MLEPESMLVWHADYLDHLDEKSLIESFEKFLEEVNFKVIGVTKDKWKAASFIYQLTLFSFPGSAWECILGGSAA